MKNRKRYKKMNTGGSISPDVAFAVGDSIASLMSSSSERGTSMMGEDLGLALQGAKLGLTVGGPAGAAIAGTAGYVASPFIRQARDKKLKKAREDQENTIAAYEKDLKLIKDRDALSRFPTRGKQTTVQFKNGGSLNKYVNGGKLSEISSDTIEVSGNSHSNGGVTLDSIGVELEGGETIANTSSEPFVFSEELGFAKKHKKIANMKKKLEDKKQDKLTKNAIDRLNSREEKLMVEQETLKSLLGLQNNKNKKQLGGLIDNENSIYNLSNKEFQEFNLGSDPMTIDPVEGRKEELPSFDTINKMKSLEESFNVDSPAFQLAQRGESFNTPQELQQGLSKYRINPDEFSSYLDSRFGKGTTGTKGYGEGDIRNIGPKNLEAFNRLKDEISNTAPKQELKVDNTIESTIPESLGEITTGNLQDNLKQISQDQKAVVTDKEVESLKSNKQLDNNSLMSLLGNTGRFIDNVGARNRIREAENEVIPSELLVDPISLDRVDFSGQIAEADRQRSLLDRRITQSLADSNVAAKVRAGNLATTISQKNQILDKENRLNTEISNREASVNKNIESSNVKTKLRNELRELGARDDIRREKQANLSNIASDIVSLTRDSKAEDIAKRQNRLEVVLSDPRKQQYFASTYPSELEKLGFSKQEIKSMQEGKFTEDQLEAFRSRAKDKK